MRRTVGLATEARLGFFLFSYKCNNYAILAMTACDFRRSKIRKLYLYIVIRIFGNRNHWLVNNTTRVFTTSTCHCYGACLCIQCKVSLLFSFSDLNQLSCTWPLDDLETDTGEWPWCIHLWDELLLLIVVFLQFLQLTAELRLNGGVFLLSVLELIL